MPKSDFFGQNNKAEIPADNLMIGQMYSSFQPL